MALEPSAARLPDSPTYSGRVSPVSKKWASRRGEEDMPTKDKSFRRYASGVDRSLSLFDTSLQEWADYIQSLGRLLKSLQAHPSNINVIPSKSIVAKRLAQCLNPTLPSGVHQKALEVYNYVFSMIGKDGLSRDLSLYLPGLSSTLSFASLTVREPFLSLLETHLLELKPSTLRPALKAIILALLPGLEEDTSEDFERTLHLVDGFKTAVRAVSHDIGGSKHAGDEYFWQCFFLASITSNSRRLGALAYLTRNLPKLGSQLRSNSTTPSLNSAVMEESDVSEQVADAVTSPEPGLLLRCFAAGLADEQLLIQRGFLDLLVTHLPLHARVLQTRVKREDLELLLASACGVVSRRDMSLNRRLWSWLLGPEPTSGTYGDGGLDSPMSPVGDPINTFASSRTRYFEDYGLQPLNRAILKMIHRDHLAPADRSRPFRICLSLMDRWEIGGLVVPEIFLPVINSVRRYEKQAASKADFNDVLRSASVFFDGVESGLIWGEIVGLMASAIEPSKVTITDKVDKLSLVKFILGHFNVREEEMITIHAPTTALAVLAMIEDLEIKIDEELATKADSSDDILRAAVGISMNLIDLIPERAFVPRSSTGQLALKEQQSWQTTAENTLVLEKIRKFYLQDQGNLDSSPPPFLPVQICKLLVLKAGNITSQSIDSSISSADITVTSRLLGTLLTKAPAVESLDIEKLLLSVHNKLSKSSQQPFSTFTSFISLTTTLYTRSYISQQQFSNFVDPLVRLGWSYLSASNPKYHVEAVRGLWQLQASLSLSNREIEAAICGLMTEHDIAGTFANRDADPGRRFSVLWTHTLQDNSGHLDRRGSKTNGESAGTGTSRASGIGNYEVILARPLFLLLDSLLDERTQLFVVVRTWLQSLVGIDKLFHLFVSKFAGFDFLQSVRSVSHEGNVSRHCEMYSEDDDLDQCLYYLQKLSNILQWSSDATWAALAQNSISTDTSHRSLHFITGQNGEVTLQEFFVHVCLRAMAGNHDPQKSQLKSRISQLHRVSLAVLHQIILNPYAAPLAEMQLEEGLIEQLQGSLDGPDPYVQVSLLDVVFATLKLRVFTQTQRTLSPQAEKHPSIQESSLNRKVSLAIDVTDHTPSALPPPPSLVKCLQSGFATPSSRPVLDSWITFLSECLPFYSEVIFQILIPLVETLCTQIGRTFENLQSTFKDTERRMGHSAAPESTLISLLNGLEQVLARGHERLLKDEARTPAVKSPDHQQGFFGNMVSGVFTSDTPQARSLNANNRLTVLLSFQDAVRICFKIWSWGGRGLSGTSQDPESIASFNYTSLRMRNRARRLLEHLFAAEALECLETVIEIWRKASAETGNTKHTVVFDLLHVLDGSRPKHTMPAIFDAIYSRTNPNALEAARKSTMTSTLLDIDLVAFLVEYSRSLEDDTMDEIWSDCMSFLRDILANPFPHRQTLPSLLEFAAVLGEKVDNTNFGEQKRMRKELGDIFLRLLTATFTTKPIGFTENIQALEKSGESEDRFPARPLNKSDDVVGILASIANNFPKILVEPDRIFAAANTISTSVVGPTFKSKAFPENVSRSVLVLLYQLTRLPNTQKSWKKDLADAFNDPRFFSTPFALVQSDWIPLLRQWALSDKERMPELISRISPPTTAGIVFGVGATSARFEADRKTQLNLRRIATLILAAAEEAFVTDLTAIGEKIVELLSATTTSSPSSTTRAEIFMVIRALILKTSPIHLTALWPIINTELHASLSSVIAPDHSQSSDTYNSFSILQACKVLDTLLCLAPDDFQLHEWLFITDTIDAVYRPSDYEPVGLIDELSEELGSTAIASAAYMEQITAATGNADRSVRRPLLGPGGVECDDVSLERKDELVDKVLRPFFSQLSIFAFERTYEMGVTDLDACRKDLLRDLFDAERGMVKAL